MVEATIAKNEVPINIKERKFQINTEAVPRVIEELNKDDPDRKERIKKLMHETGKTPWEMARYFVREATSITGTAAALASVEDINPRKAGELLREICFSELDGIAERRARLEAEGRVINLNRIIVLGMAQNLGEGERREIEKMVIEEERQELEEKEKEITGILDEIIRT